MKPNLLFVFGTRPEAIKMAPIIHAFRKDDNFKVTVCLTAQHKELLYPIVNFFKIDYQYDLQLMKYNQTLSTFTSNAIQKLDGIVLKEKPDMIFVQGDTTTVLVAGLVAFYHKVKVAHIEAGLRSFDKYSPFPEETNRLIVSQIAHIHFAPTEMAMQNLLKQNIIHNVYITGNSVIDALHLCLAIIRETGETPYRRFFNFIDFSKKVILLTCHRRESFGEGVENIFEAVKQFAMQHTEAEIVYPLHPNPNVQTTAKNFLSGIKNIKLIPALDYPHLIWLMSKCWFVLTDSGGIQEEAPALGKPVLVTRKVTERVEAVTAGTAKLVGTDTTLILNEMNKLLDNGRYYKKFSKSHNPYGNGTTAKKIVEIITNMIYEYPAKN